MDVIIISVLSAVSVLLFVLLLINRKKLKRVNQERTDDILKTNDILLKKSEKELELFFEFEAVVEESIRISRANKLLSREKFALLIELQEEIIKLLK